MKTAERVLGFASCALGLLPLIGDVAKAQQLPPVACQAVNVVSAGGAGAQPLASPPGNQRVLVCGYSITTLGTLTAVSNIVAGYGTACATANGYTQTPISAQVQGSSSLVRSNLAILLVPGANVCLNGLGGTTSVSIELNYSIQ